MAARLLARSGFCLLAGLAFPGYGPGLIALADEDEAIPDKVGAEVHLSKQERGTLKKVECTMCKAIIREMHAEVKKHKMVEKGWGSESQVIETSNAMCLAMLQKYKLDLEREKIEKKAEDEDEEMAMQSGGNPQLAMRGMLVLKMGCQFWLEDYGSDTSGFIYRRVADDIGSPDASAKEFCNEIMSQCGKGKKEAEKKKKEKSKEQEQKRREMRKIEDKEEAKREEDNPFKNLPKDSMAGMQRMLEMSRDDPLGFMEESAKLRIQQGQKDLRCGVCRAALEQVHEDVAKRPKSMRAEFDILPFAETMCEGGKDLSVPGYFGIEPPPLPPLWTDKYRAKLNKKSNKFQLKSFPKKAAKKRRAWRKLTPEGQQKPPPQEEHEADMMMTLSCKDVMEPARMTEVLYEKMVACGSGKEATCDAALATARQTCRDVDDAACIYDSEEVKETSDESSKTSSSKGSTNKAEEL